MPAAQAGKIITFYSYKGGTGRSMQLANVAWILASNGKKVLVVDWDLEAPGLHRYFYPFLMDKDLTSSDGLIDFLVDFAIEAATPEKEDGEPDKRDWYKPYTNILRYSASLNWEFPQKGMLDFIPAGRQGPSYSMRVNAFNWQHFYDRLGGGVFLEAVKENMKAEYDYILIDSRTGVSDTSGICTVQMPDILVVCFTLNYQGIEGAAAVASSVFEQRKKSGLNIFPVPMRIDTFEKAKLEMRRDYAKKKFVQFPDDVPPEKQEQYWGDVQVPYIAYYGYEEILASFADSPGDAFSILTSAERLTSYLTKGEVSQLNAESVVARQEVVARFARESRSQQSLTVLAADERSQITKLRRDLDARKRQTTVPRFDVFLSHSSREKSVVERIAEKLKREGFEPWLDKWHLTAGGDWQDELAAGMSASGACAIFVGPGGLGNWEDMEYKVAVDRMATDRAFRVFLVLLPGLPEPFDTSVLPPFLATRTWIDFRRGIEDALAFQSLINAIRGFSLGPGRPVEARTDICPYRGLHTFGEEHAEFFFGRDSEIQRLIEILKGTRFLTIIGPSGSGKSSLVGAGLIPVLKRGALPGSDTWAMRILSPGQRPLNALAADLLRFYPLYSQNAVGRIVDEMSNDERTLHLAVSLALKERSTTERVIWIIDQFEEVFTLCADERERSHFIANLLYAASVPDGRNVVVLTVRSDFISKCAEYRELSERVASHAFFVSPMSVDGLRQVIEEPAWLVGLEIEEGLVRTILDDVAGQPGALPLLEHALLELWERRRGTFLTLEAYRESGGVEGAIAKRADAIYDSFTAEQQAIMRRIMLRLTQPGEGTEDTRRRAMMDELVTRPDETDAVENVTQTMAKARLLTIYVNEQTGLPVVDISHEALIRGWPRLRSWIEENRAGLRVFRQLIEAAREWDNLSRDSGLLYRGVRLAQGLEWEKHNELELSQLEREFLNASVALKTHEETRERLRLYVFSGLTVALLMSLLLLFYYWSRLK